MGAIWTKAFWKDAIERLGTTLVAILIGAMTASDFGWTMLDDWKFWSPIAVSMGINLLKVLLAGFASPNTGASLGTTNPAGIVKAFVTQKDVVTEGDKVGPGMPDEVVARAGDTVAGNAATQANNTPVDVTAIAA